MQDFKIKVTPETSKEVQELLFACGYYWANGFKEVFQTDKQFLVFSKVGLKNIQNISWCFREYFYKSDIRELTIEQFRSEIQCPCIMECLQDDRICKHTRKLEKEAHG